MQDRTYGKEVAVGIIANIGWAGLFIFLGHNIVGAIFCVTAFLMCLTAFLLKFGRNQKK